MEQVSKVKEFMFDGYKCYGKACEYQNNNLAIQVKEVGTDEDFTMATVNTDDILKPGLAYISDYSENEGLLDILVEAGIVTEVIGYTPSGFVILPLCRINEELLQH